MRTTAFIAFMLMLWVVADTGLAHAQDAANGSPAVRHELSDWLEDARVFRSGAQDTARLWQRDAPLLDARTDIFVSEAESFADVTETYANRIRRIAPSSDAAALLHEVARDIEDRLAALSEARAGEAASVTQVLNGMDRIVYQVFFALGGRDARQAQAQAESAAPIRVSYVTELSQAANTAPAQVASAH